MLPVKITQNKAADMFRKSFFNVLFVEGFMDEISFQCRMRGRGPCGVHAVSPSDRRRADASKRAARSEKAVFWPLFYRKKGRKKRALARMPLEGP
jgi:hypothetical protein